MAAEPSTVGGATDLGKGLFGYRKADVRQMLADRDGMLMEAEKRMRSSTARIAELESAVAATGDENAQLREQVSALQARLQALSARNAEVEKAALRIKAEGERLAAWRKRLQAVAVTAPAAVERFRLLIEQIPGRVQEALTPVALSAPALLARMDACAHKLGEPTPRNPLERVDRSR
jgi:septal ring factor EnvC (AmiA/AmiB activator)